MKEFTEKYGKIAMVFIIIAWAFRNKAPLSRHKMLLNIAMGLAVILIIIENLPPKWRHQKILGIKLSNDFSGDTEQCKRTYEAEKKIKKKLWELMLAGKIHGFGVSYDPPRWGERCVIHVRAEELTKNLMSQVPKWVDGVEVVWEQGEMAHAQ